ncbi:hypothetical protein [Chryseolinea lacunae]|uniref:DUF4488 domain-containing protein n=1 Tax=Chryseolinea lacunae TaxID=2801331 RepID=A0ABS1L2V1_9BACT|nr:hypothetical protein [Chryseolinea lacunae]MBL0745895.1 hypothetical protein [Chryseolinea lacunae]
MASDKKIFLLIAIIIVVLISCQVNRLPDRYSQFWGVILLETDGQQFTIYGEKDSIVLKRWDYKDSVTQTGQIWIPINIRTESVKIRKEEADSVYKWTKKLTNDVFLPEKFCTDYVGHLKVTIEYGGSVKQSCEYSSMCDWRTMSKETMKLSKMFDEKFAILK